MNYLQLFQDSWRLFRTTRLIGVFGFLALLITIPLPPPESLRDNPVLVCIYLPSAVVILCITTIANGSLYFVIHRASLNETVLFSRAWAQGKAKMLRLLGLLILSIPLLLIGGVFMRLVIARMPTSPYLLLILWVMALVMISLFTFSSCAVMIDNVKLLAAAWTSVLLTINNFGRVFVISGLIYILRLLFTVIVTAILASGLFGIELPTPLTFNYPTYQRILTLPIVAWTNWIFNLLLFPLEAVMLTLVYLRSTKEIAYPALGEGQATA